MRKIRIDLELDLENWTQDEDKRVKELLGLTVFNHNRKYASDLFPLQAVVAANHWFYFASIRYPTLIGTSAPLRNDRQVSVFALIPHLTAKTDRYSPLEEFLAEVIKNLPVVDWALLPLGPNRLAEAEELGSKTKVYDEGYEMQAFEGRRVRVYTTIPTSHLEFSLSIELSNGTKSKKVDPN